MKRLQMVFLSFFVTFAVGAWAQNGAPLKLIHTILLPGLHSGDFDNFAVDFKGRRLFLAAEANSAVEVFDLRTNKLIRTVTGLKEPHSILYRSDLKRIFVIDGGDGDIKIYGGDSYQPMGSIKLRMNCDSIAYDPETKYMYVVNGGKIPQVPYSFISIIDTTAAKELTDIKIDCNFIDNIILDKPRKRLFANLTGENAVGVIDLTKRTVIATWSIAKEAHLNLPMAFDATNGRLFIAARKPAKFIVLNASSGRIVASQPCVGVADSVVYDAGSKRIYVAGSGAVSVFSQRSPDDYRLIATLPTSYRAKTAILVPELKSYYVAAPRHGTHSAAVRVYEVTP
ncbi:MAG: YncE family protein [Terriglobia bacterium]